MTENESQGIDRLSVRRPPEGSPLLFQEWRNLLFMHWPVPGETMRRLVPNALTVDTYDGSAWVGITPFTAHGTRARYTPPVPYVSSFHEMNVRTYVHVNGVPGVYFFSLDANSISSVLGARAFFHLPYYWARMQSEQQGDTFIYTATRHSSSRPADFRAVWSTGDSLPDARPGTRRFFLIERYCLYTTYENRLYRARIHHEPWPLREADLSTFDTSYLRAHDLQPNEEEPIVHFSEGVHAKIWALQEI